jgi:alpha-glutamyl/putrescinyl thymine pyrophosphorylase clade 1
MDCKKIVQKYEISSKAFDDYLLYINLRDESTNLRLLDKAHPHPYFTNHPSCQNRRYMDRESQYFISRRNEYKSKYPITDAAFQLIFRKASTYDSVRDTLEEYPGDLISKGRINQILEVLKSITTPFTGAYLVPHRDKQFTTKIEGWLNIFQVFDFEKLSNVKSAREGYQLLRNIPGMGDFLSMQFITELGWLNETQYGGNEFVIPGNGAVRGLSKLGLNKTEFINFLFDLVSNQTTGISPWLPMTLMDYQNTFCEFDKFTRYLGGYDNQGRNKMKRLRRPNKTPITKFEITDKLKSPEYFHI